MWKLESYRNVLYLQEKSVQKRWKREMIMWLEYVSWTNNMDTISKIFFHRIQIDVHVTGWLAVRQSINATQTFFFYKDRYDEEEKKLFAFCWFSPLLLHFFPTPMYLGQYLVGWQIRL